MDEPHPAPSSTPEKMEIPHEKPPEAEKKNRRRSSIGGDILNAFMNSGNEETMSPVEPRASRPRRAASVRPAVVIPPASVAVRKKPVRFSFDLGERIETKSCLKPSTAPILIRGGPAAKSLTQQTAQKVLSKYRKSRSLSKTPHMERESKLRFDKICTIRVMTPRPEYDPDNLEMPHSDDEEEKKADPNRERLSTVTLRLTPTSEAKLEDMQNSEVVQFRAEMVFGDTKYPLKASESVESVGSSDTAILISPDAPEGSRPVFGPNPTPASEIVVEQPTKKSRRKSLIVGAASPLKIPQLGIETPRFDEIIEDQISEPKRKPRRSCRLNPTQMEAQLIVKPEQLEEDEDDVKLHEEEVHPVSMSPESEKEEPQKKRELQNTDDVGSSEPQPKRIRRKSAGPLRLQKPSEVGPEADDKRKNRRKTILKKEDDVTDSEEKSEDKTKRIADIFSAKPKKSEGRSNRRRSSRFVNVSCSDDSEKDVPTTSVVPEVISVDIETSEDAPGAPVPSDVITKSPKAPEPSTPKPLASIFVKPSSSGPKKVEILKKPGKYVEAEKHRILEDVKKHEAKPSTSSSPAPKLFSLFSPKLSKPTPIAATSSDAPTPTVTIDLTSNSPSSTPSRAFCASGIRREATWGESHPETYQFFQNVPEDPSIFPEDSEFVLMFKSSEDMKPDLALDPEFHLQMRRDSETIPTVLTSSSPSSPLQKFDLPECDPTTVWPTTMDQLVEGAEEEMQLRNWLRRWKRKVRNDQEREMAKEKAKEKKKKRKRNEDDDEDYDAGEDGVEYDNPLVLIGPTGVGKSALIRSLAKHEDMRLLITGPEVLRTGKEMKERLQEAMKSHRVDRQTNCRMTLFYSSGPKTYEKRDFTQTLIVIENVDVFFESIDRNGIGGILEMVNEARVPIVFTCERDWPRKWGAVELESTPIEVRMGKKKEKVQEFVQKLIYSSRGVYIDSPTMSRLSESVDHDLRSLINQANFYAISPTRPLPLTTRFGVSDGFSSSWDTFRRNELKMDRMEHLVDQYSEVLEHLPTQHLPNFIGIEKLWDDEARGAAERQGEYAEDVQTAFTALNGRYSRREIAMDMLPMLAPMDRVEKGKIRNSRRHLHRFLWDTEATMDGDALIGAVAKWTKGLL